MLRKIRLMAATLCFVLITLLFLDFTGTLHGWFGWLAKIQFLPAVLALNVGVVLLLILLTLVFGRIYCSVICPLGVFQDVIARFGRIGKKLPYSYSPALSWLRYGVLAVFVAALVAGVGSFVALLAPYSAYGRIANSLLQPLWMWGNNLLAYLAERMDSYAFYEVDVWMKSLSTLLVAVATVVVLFVLAWRNGRTYCNTICPVGTVLGFISRFSLYRITIDTEKCNSCGLCTRQCKAACIDGKQHKVDGSRCVVCMNCLDVCRKNALSYAPVWKAKKQETAATMKDVALKAKVSTATVSRALMNPDKVSQATRNRVEKAAREVGYLPQPMGRNVKRNESRTILVIVPDICDPFFSEIIRGIEVTAANHGYLVLIGDCAHQNQQEKTFIDLIITKQIDGMLLLGSRLPFDASIEEQRNLPPMVMANEFAPELELPTVHIDNLTAAFDAVNYLYEQGHKRIGCIAGPEEMPLCHYRLQGYVQALRRCGIMVDPQYIARGDFTFEAGSKAMQQLLDLPQPPTAVFCHSDVMALGALSQAKRQGLKVPEDLSIIGFDNIDLTQFCDPPLTTIAQPRYEIGREAMLLLLDQMQGQHVGSGSRLMDCELIIRGSTRALP